MVVIGGGETGTDCVETALNQGAGEVHQLEILPRGLTESDQTLTPPGGVKRRWCVATQEFTANAGALKNLSAVEVKWLQTPAGQVMEKIPDSEFGLSVDMAVLAVGFEPVIDPGISEQLNLATDPGGKVIATDYATSVKGVFVAGDIATVASLVVTAINSGRKAAEKIDEYLRTSCP